MTIPDTIVTDLMSSVVTTVNSVIPLIVIIFGVAICFYVAKMIVSILPKH